MALCLRARHGSTGGPASRNDVTNQQNMVVNIPLSIRPEFFYFSFYRPSRPNILEIEKKIKEIFFSILLFLFRSDSCQYSTGVQLCFFLFVFSIAARLIKLPPVTAPGEILPF